MRASLWALLAAFVAVVMGALIKYVGQRIPVFEILFIRQLCVIAVISPIVVRDIAKVFRTKLIKFHILRGCCSAIAMTTGFTAVIFMPLAEVTAISFSRILFTTLLAIFILGEKVGTRRWAVTFTGFLGVLVILRPDAGEINVYAVLALISALFVASIMIMLRKLSQVDKPSTIMAYQSVFITTLLAGPTYYFWVPLTLTEVALILVIGGLLSMMQWSYIRALKLAEAVVLAPLEYIRLLFATLIGMMVFSEVPTLWTISGAAIIIASTLYTVHRNAIRQKEKRPNNSDVA